VQFLKAALQDIKITLKSQGKQLRSYCYVADCAAGIITALLKGQTNCAYNIANSSSVTTIKNLAETIAKLAGKRIEYCKLERTRDDSPIQHQVLDADRLEKLGWQGKYDLVLGLRHTLSIMQQEELEKNAREVKTASL
jgi:nucleoside-diphosphate-sugar epimerase